jgi:SAM-dependent methyltransferase
LRQTDVVQDVQTAEDVGAAYDVRADEFAEAFRSTEPEQPIELAMVEHFAAQLPAPRRVLDAGCGAGRFLPILGSLGCEVEGLDISPNMIRHAQQKHHTFASRVGSLLNLPLDDGSLDGYFAWYSTIHSDEALLRLILGEARRTLRLGGSVLVAFQSGEGIQDLSEAYRSRGHNLSLLRYLRSIEEMTAALVAAGFEVSAQLERGPVAAHERGNQAVIVAKG